MNEMGGINRVIGGYQTGFTRLGHKVYTYHASRRGGLRNLYTDKYGLQTKWWRPKAHNLGWDNAEHHEVFKRKVKKADLILFTHPCPHPTKANAGDKSWHKLYKICRKAGTPTAILFTDNLWDRMYPWITDVVKDGHPYTLFYNNYNAGFDSMARLGQESHYTNYPMDFDEIQPEVERDMDLIWMPQWKRWKGIHQLIEDLAKHPDRIKVDFYNSGIEYYKERLLPQWRRAIALDEFAERQVAKGKQGVMVRSKKKYGARAIVHGLVAPDKVSPLYARSKAMIDLSGMYAKKFNSQVTCAMIEGMMNGCVVAAPPQVENNEQSLLQGQCLVFPVNPRHITKSLARIVADEDMRGEIAARAFKYVSDNCRDDQVAQHMLDVMSIS